MAVTEVTMQKCLVFTRLHVIVILHHASCNKRKQGSMLSKLCYMLQGSV